MVGVGSEREGSQRAEWAAIVRGRGHKRVTDEVTRRTMRKGETSKVQRESGRGSLFVHLFFGVVHIIIKDIANQFGAV